MRNTALAAGCAIVLLIGWSVSARDRAQAPPAVAAVPALPASHPSPVSAPRDSAGSGAPGQRVEVAPPPFSDGIFPCTGCHNKDMPPNRTRRQLEMHTEIELKHDTEHRWCLDCHDADHRDELHLASGEPVPFEESYRLCGQCHGEKYRDWRAGVHGRRVGHWNGAKRYLLCVHCHNPHQPKFKPLAPQPAPRRPMRPDR